MERNLGRRLQLAAQLDCLSFNSWELQDGYRGILCDPRKAARAGDTQHSLNLIAIFCGCTVMNS